MPAIIGPTHQAVSLETSATDFIVGSPGALSAYQAAAWPTALYTEADSVGVRPTLDADLSVGRIPFSVPQGSRLLLRFFGAGAENDDQAYFLLRKRHFIRAATTRAAGVAEIFQSSVNVLLEGSYTLSQKLGAVNGWPSSSHRYADIITVAAAYDRTLSPLKIQYEAPPSMGDNDIVTLSVDGLAAGMYEMFLRRGTAGAIPTALGFMYGGVGG